MALTSSHRSDYGSPGDSVADAQNCHVEFDGGGGGSIGGSGSDHRPEKGEIVCTMTEPDGKVGHYCQM